MAKSNKRPKKGEAFKRPFTTHYYSDIYAQGTAYVSQGHSATAHGGVRAAVVRIFLQEYAKAVIIDRVDDIPVYTIKMGAAGLRIDYGRGEDAPHLRRVK